jgi:DNA-binding transcriptional MerR regulator
MRIGELAKYAAVNASAIRYYEKIGLLAQPDRLNGQRRYPTDALDRVLLIRFATEMDFTLAENTPVSSRWRKLASRKIAELQQRLMQTQRLVEVLRRLQLCRCIELHQCVSGLSLSPHLRALRSTSLTRSPRSLSPLTAPQHRRTLGK